MITMTTILIVEDEQSIADILQYNLKQNGYETLHAKTGTEGVSLFEAHRPQLVLLDIMLPELDGYEVCRQIRTMSHAPIIMLSAKDSEIDKIIGLELGADDYMAKPFSNRELLARVKANLRTPRLDDTLNNDTTNILICGPLEINKSAYSVKKHGIEIELTHREFDLLAYLAQELLHVRNREHLLEHVWGYDYFGDVRTVDVTIRRLREKLEDDPKNPKWIKTKRGVGYFMSE